ncbi:hypothetical protein TNCV_335771 [Trichonephila clavipes]|nr:hypothetical protein TNCV_335771 [Trichonephila clavipes]
MGSGTAMHTWEAHRRLLLLSCDTPWSEVRGLPVVLECKGHLRYHLMYASGMVLESPSGGELPFSEVTDKPFQVAALRLYSPRSFSDWSWVRWGPCFAHDHGLR